MNIFWFVFSVLGYARVWPAVCLNIAIIMCMAWAVYQQSILMQTNMDDYNSVRDLAFFFFLENFVLDALNTVVLQRYIMLPFQLMVNNELASKLLDASPVPFLFDKINPNELFNPALGATVSLVENSLSIINPIGFLISRGYALTTKIDVSQMFLVIGLLSIFFVIGISVLFYDHRKSKELSKRRAEIGEIRRSIITSSGSIIVNGMGLIVKEWLATLQQQIVSLEVKHEIITNFLYKGLRTFATIIPFPLVWKLKGSGDFFPLYMIIQPLFWNCWWLFWTTKSVIVSTSPWTMFAEFLKNRQPLSKNLPKPELAKEMLSIFGKELDGNPIREVKLCGPSGCGKTTFMMKTVANLCTKWVQGSFCYIEQFASIPDNVTVCKFFTSGFPDLSKLPSNFKEMLFEYAKALGVENIVNELTFEKSFGKLSGGEKKRIIFMHFVLPILMDVSKVKILFLDEISAGLDKDAFLKVRHIVELIKENGIVIVSIDHHECSADLEVNVEKRIITISKPSTKKESLLNKFVKRFSPNSYKKEIEESDLEMGEIHEETTVEVRGISSVGDWDWI